MHEKIQEAVRHDPVFSKVKTKRAGRSDAADNRSGRGKKGETRADNPGGKLG